MNSFESTFNLAEAGLWFVVSLVLAVKAVFAASLVRPMVSLLASAFLVFGISDLIEARTGSWWDPLWFLGLKASCVATFLVGLRKYYRLSRPRTDTKGTAEPDPKSAPQSALR